MPGYRYNGESHKQAFELFFESRNVQSVSHALGASWKTVQNWADPAFICIDSCPYHGWELLCKEREESVKLRAELVSKRVYDPVQHDAAIRGLNMPLALRPEAVSTIRPSIERVAHLEFLWSKVFYDATGIVTDWQAFTQHGSKQLGPAEDIAKRESLEKGMHASSLRQAVEMLRDLDRMIREAKVDLAEQAHSFGMFPEVKEIEAVSVADLRRMRREAITSIDETVIEVTDATTEEDPSSEAEDAE